MNRSPHVKEGVSTEIRRQLRGVAMAEKTCPKHGKWEDFRECPACKWVRLFPNYAKHESGCPRCGEPLDSNGLLMWCSNDSCPMCSTSHHP